MNQRALLERLIALNADHGNAHRSMLAALDANDLIGLVQASRRQGDLCSEQGAMLATYIASVVSLMPDVDARYRERVDELVRQLRREHDERRTQKAGGSP